jgi:hypothetical protein
LGKFTELRTLGNLNKLGYNNNTRFDDEVEDLKDGLKNIATKYNLKINIWKFFKPDGEAFLGGVYGNGLYEINIKATYDHFELIKKWEGNMEELNLNSNLNPEKYKQLFDNDPSEMDDDFTIFYKDKYVKYNEQNVELQKYVKREYEKYIIDYFNEFNTKTYNSFIDIPYLNTPIIETKLENTAYVIITQKLEKIKKDYSYYLEAYLKDPDSGITDKPSIEQLKENVNNEIDNLINNFIFKDEIINFINTYSVPSNIGDRRNSNWYKIGKNRLQVFSPLKYYLNNDNKIWDTIKEYINRIYRITSSNISEKNKGQEVNKVYAESGKNFTEIEKINDFFDGMKYTDLLTFNNLKIYCLNNQDELVNILGNGKICIFIKRDEDGIKIITEIKDLNIKITNNFLKIDDENKEEIKKINNELNLNNLLIKKNQDNNIKKEIYNSNNKN